MIMVKERKKTDEQSQASEIETHCYGRLEKEACCRSAEGEPLIIEIGKRKPTNKLAKTKETQKTNSLFKTK